MTPGFPLTSLCPLFQIAPVENDDSYDELKRDAKTCLSLMSQGLLYTEQIPMVLSALQEVSYLPAVAVIPLFTCITHDWAFHRPSHFITHNIDKQKDERFKGNDNWVRVLSLPC